MFGIDISVQNTVGEAAYGFYFSLFNFSLLFNIFLDLGITNYNNRMISMHHQLLDKFFSHIAVLKFFLGILYLSVVLIFGVFIGYSDRQLLFLILLCFNQFLASLILYLRSNISGLHLFPIDSMLSILDRLLMIVILGYLLLFHKESFRIEMLVYSQSGSYIITAGTAFLILRTRMNKVKLRLHIPFLRLILRKSYPYTLLVLLMYGYTRTDGILLERLLPEGESEAGIYAQGYRLLDTVNQFTLLFTGLLLPMFAKMIKDKESVIPLLKTSFLLVIIPGSMLSLNAFFFQKEIISYLYKDAGEESIRVFGILMLCFIPISISYIFGVLLTANGSLRSLNIVSFICLIANVFLNLILIPEFKSFGACTSSFITQSIAAFLQIIVAYRVFHIKRNTQLLYRLILFLIITGLSGYFSYTYIEDKFFSVVLSISLSILSIFLLKLIGKKEVFAIIKGIKEYKMKQ